MSQSTSFNPLAGPSAATPSAPSVNRADLTNPPDPFQSRVVWALLAVTAVLFVGLFWEVIERGARAAVDPDWAHIAAAPAVAIAYILGNRTRIAELPAKLYWPGLAVVFLGLFSYLWWVFPGRNDMFRGYSLILTLFGMVLFAFGPNRMRMLWFPIAYLVFAVKIPDSIWEQVAFQLTLVAAAGSEITLNVASKLLDFYITKDGQAFTMMWTDANGRMVQESFNIANACSGLRALMTFIALGVAMAFLWDRMWWQRLVLMASSIPVALAVNIARVTTLGLLNLWDPQLAQGQSHIAVGMLWLIPGLILFLGIGKLLDMMVIEPEDEVEPPPLQERPILIGRADMIGCFVVVWLCLAVVGLFLRSANPELLPVGRFIIVAAALAGVLAIALTIYELLIRNVLEKGLHRHLWKPPSAIGDEANEGAGKRVMGLLPVLVGGAGLALMIGGVYIFTLNGVTASPMIEALNSSASYTVASSSLIVAVVLALVMRRRVITIVAGLTLLVGVLATTAVGFQSAVRATEVALIKQAVEMRHGFLVLPKQLGDAAEGTGPQWDFVHDDPPLDKYIEDELGTEHYITRYYRDTSLPEEAPGSIARVHLAYYTGMIDTVPHVPDRCWVAGGIASAGAETYESTLELTGAVPDENGSYLRVPAQLKDPIDNKSFSRMPGATVPLRTFAGVDPSSGTTLRATYFFVANGGFYASANDVRLLGFDPRDKYSYYCKVEVTFPGVSDAEESKERVAAFLSDLMPEVMSVVPDWVDVRAGRWPASDAAFAAAAAGRAGGSAPETEPTP
ncbi:MAG: exosortase/archaeosortase family protein [Planctomycetota bacterium]